LCSQHMGDCGSSQDFVSWLIAMISPSTAPTNKALTFLVSTLLLDEKGTVQSINRTEHQRGFKDIHVGHSIFVTFWNNAGTIDLIKKAFQGNTVTIETTEEDLIFSNHFTPVFNESGKIANVIVTSFDITESKRAADSTAKSEFKLRMLFDSAHDAIFTMDHKTFIDCNPATLRIFECTREQIVGQTPFRFSPPFQPDGRSSEEAALEKINAALSGVSQSFEWRHIRYDGTAFEAEVSLNRLDLPNEVLIQAIVRDVSERKKAEDENRRLAMVANNTTNMIVVADGKGMIQWVNPAFTRITGYSLPEVAGKTPGSILRGPQSDPEVCRFMGDMIRKGEGFKDVEIINYNKHGNPYWVQIEVQPIYDKAGRVVQYIAIESDVTERKATQQALLERHEALMKTNAELDRFVYSASHDLRAPIASLLGLIEVAKLETDIGNIDHLLDLQKKSLLRLDSFIRDIVDYSRNERLQVDVEIIHFEQMIHATFEQLNFMDNVDRIKKVIQVKTSSDFYSARLRIDILLNNLISNAIKYADLKKEQPLLEVDVEVDSQKATIKVRDNGEGILPEAKSQIFNMFFRASAKGSGSGLGLYIVKEAVQKIGGTIDVTSDYGQGTEFTIEIPNLQPAP
jgi:PAS domain S-box-containing protein